ncbi:MAG: phage holin family protein [bacterium]
MPSTELDHRNEQPAELITGVISDARDLAMAEVDKLKAEAVTQVKTVGEEVTIVRVGALILTVAAIMLGTSFSLGVAALGVPPWAGFGIVAVVFGLAGYVFITQRRAIAKAT